MRSSFGIWASCGAAFAAASVAFAAIGLAAPAVESFFASAAAFAAAYFGKDGPRGRNRRRRHIMAE